MPGPPFRLLRISRADFEQMLRHALDERPNECCGLLAGVTAEDGTGRVQRRYPLVNAAASPVEFLSDGRSMLDAVRDMCRAELDILAVYHSHPTSEPVPSRTDLERNYSPEVVNLIISLGTTPPRVRGWWLTEEQYREAEWEVEG